MADESKFEKSLHIRVFEDTEKRIQQAARRQGVSASTWCRGVLSEATFKPRNVVDAIRLFADAMRLTTGELPVNVVLPNEVYDRFKEEQGIEGDYPSVSVDMAGGTVDVERLDG